MAPPAKRTRLDTRTPARGSSVQRNDTEAANSDQLTTDEERNDNDETIQDTDLLNQPKVFNDPVHGHIELPSLLVKIVDTPQFQRLRDIKQLGGAHFVYPGATHTRFEHSLGVGYLAGLLIKSLKERQPELNITDEDVLCIQIAGLCHDLGHGPFSHLFDNVFLPSVREGYKKKHEEASVEMFDHLIKSNKLDKDLQHAKLSPADVNFIKALILGMETQEDTGRPKEKEFLYHIVANKRSGVDVDKWDYLARDCHYLGFKNNFDYKRILHFVRVCKVGDDKQIVFRDKEAANIYDMFYLRHSLHRRAYQHKVVKGIELMVNDAFKKADKCIKISGKDDKTFNISTAIDDMEAYTKLTDRIYDQILHSSEENLQPARDILNRIVKRSIYRCIGEEDLGTSFGEMPSESKTKTYTEEDLIVYVVTFDYGMEKNDPVKNIQFYSKLDVKKPFPIEKNKVSLLLPETFEQKLVRVYCKLEDDDIQETIKERFREWCENWRSEMLKVAEEAKKAKASKEEGRKQEKRQIKARKSTFPTSD
uniref:deoxynucleoside triphosphate triphosphohydrolase SAMHD1 isoform X2 n=1 Tax=Myxine glutinosa TaxID=7769 RepID=UPI00358F1901